MPGIEFYEKLLNNPCEGCAAYEEIGGCGTWINTCKVPQWTEDLYQLLLFLGWDENEFLDYIKFKDSLEEIEYFIEEDEYFEELAIDIDYEVQQMQDLQYLPDEPIFY